ncbi:hypothetical protein OAQ99_01665 [Candidatus Kapabacteria bacterium]|nr:hypothetical protein [Candidatus Kapabacteria bacterium]
MYTITNKFDKNNYKPQLFKAREAVLVSRIDKIKKTIMKLQSGLNNNKMNDNLKSKFESKIANESEIALQLVIELKKFRVINNKYLMS